jgi:hypothetical protein
MGNSSLQDPFQPGDEIEDPAFREKLNTVARMAADGTSWAFGFGLLGAYSAGTGFTLAFDEGLLRQFQAGVQFTEVEITGDDGEYHSWAAVVGDQTGTLNLREINGRRITPGHKVLIWPDPNDAEKYLFDRGEGVGDGAFTIIIEGEDAEGTVGTSWDRRTAASPDGVTISVVLNVRYQSNKLQKKFGQMQFDSSGRLVAVNSLGPWADVFEAEDCPPEEDE